MRNTMAVCHGTDWTRAEERRKDELAFALISRVMTDAEMGEVAELGFRLFTRYFVSYNENEMHLRLCDALLQQFKLRAASSALAQEQGR